MGLSADKDVKFDWYGSLSLARQLWAYADDLEAASTVRMNDANASRGTSAALVSFTWRMRSPPPSRRLRGSGRSLPRQKPKLT